jgi:hypothetical protein
MRSLVRAGAAVGGGISFKISVSIFLETARGMRGS